MEILDILNLTLILILFLLLGINYLIVTPSPGESSNLNNKKKRKKKRRLCRISRRNLKRLFRKIGPRKKKDIKKNLPKTIWKNKYKKTSKYLDDFDVEYEKFRKKKIIFRQKQQRKIYKKKRWY